MVLTSASDRDSSRTSKDILGDDRVPSCGLLRRFEWIWEIPKIWEATPLSLLIRSVKFLAGRTQSQSSWIERAITRPNRTPISASFHVRNVLTGGEICRPCNSLSHVVADLQTPLNVFSQYAKMVLSGAFDAYWGGPGCGIGGFLLVRRSSEI